MNTAYLAQELTGETALQPCFTSLSQRHRTTQRLQQWGNGTQLWHGDVGHSDFLCPMEQSQEALIGAIWVRRGKGKYQFNKPVKHSTITANVQEKGVVSSAMTLL